MSRIEFSEIQGLEKLGKEGSAIIYKAPPGALHPQILQPVAIKKYRKKVLVGNEEAIGHYLDTLIKNRRRAPSKIRKIMDQFTI